MIALDLDAIRARADKATPGPWRWRGNTDHDDPRLVGERWNSVMAMVRRERHADDPETKSYESYLHECEMYEPGPLASEGKYRSYTDEEIAEKIQDEWLHDPWGEPRHDERMAFRDHDSNIMVYARDLSIYEVCPSATIRADDRVYRADIVGVRHPDAEFIAHAREDVSALIAEVDRLRGELAQLKKGS